MITGKTRYYAILGDPIEQALSPVVHNAAFEALGMDAVMLGCLSLIHISEPTRR